MTLGVILEISLNKFSTWHTSGGIPEIIPKKKSRVVFKKKKNPKEISDGHL